jgi:hypothetical protein
MAKFILYWLDGKKEVVEGNDIASAFSSAGLGGGAINALDFYENGDTPTYNWNAKRKEWIKLDMPNKEEQS